MLLSTRLAAPVLLAAWTLGCGGGSKAPESKPNAPAQAPAAPAAQTGQMTVAAGDFGVPECDEYVRKHLACIEKAPEMARTMFKQTLDQSRSAWKQAAATPQGRATLAVACKQAEAAAKQAMSMYACTW